MRPRAPHLWQFTQKCVNEDPYESAHIRARVHNSGVSHFAAPFAVPQKANGTPYRRHTCHARSAEQRRDPRARHSWRCIRHQPRRNLSRHYSRRNTRRCVEAEPTPAQLCAATVSTGKCQRRTLLRKCHGAVLGAQNVPQRNCPKKMRRPRRPSALTFRGEAPYPLRLRKGHP